MLREKKKKRTFILLVKEKRYNYYLSQETYWTTDLLSVIEKQWGGQVFLNPGTQHSKDTAIIFNSNTNIEVRNKHT